MQPRKYLIQAIRKLMNERGIEQIIVQDILDEAQVSRGTFYKYFWDKYDLANAYYAEHVRDHILPRYDGSNWHELLVELLAFISENKDYFCQLNDLTIHGFAQFLLEYGDRCYGQNYLANTGKRELGRKDRYALEFYNAGCVRVISCWLRDECAESPDRIAGLILELLPAVYYNVHDAVALPESSSYQIASKNETA